MQLTSLRAGQLGYYVRGGALELGVFGIFGERAGLGDQGVDEGVCCSRDFSCVECRGRRGRRRRRGGEDVERQKGDVEQDERVRVRQGVRWESRSVSSRHGRGERWQSRY